MEWWYWVSAGILILLAEAVTPGGFYLVFIGLAAIVTGVFSILFDVLWIQIITFALLSTVFIAVFRKPMVNRLKKATPQADIPEFIGETASAAELIPAGGEGNVELRGSIWKARNTGDKNLNEKDSCVILSREGLLFVVKPKH
jgi:membrane protein implicated in regulation of membrane protease activity